MSKSSSSFHREAVFENLVKKILRKCNSECYSQNVSYICDMIKEKHIAPKYALRIIRSTFHHPNHHVGRFSYLILNTCVENCGPSMNDASTKNKYLRELKRDIYKCPHTDIRIQALMSLHKWDFAFAQYSIFAEDELPPVAAAAAAAQSQPVKKHRKKRSPNNRLRKTKSTYHEYFKFKTRMLSGAKKGSHMNRIDPRKGSYTPQSTDFSSNENTVLCEKIYPFALVLRLRVLQIVCGISGIVMGTVAFIEEKGNMNLGIGMPAGLLTITAAAGSIHTSRGFGGYVQPSCDPPWSHLRFLGPTLMSAISLTLLWSSAYVLHCVLLWNAFKAFFATEDLTVLSVVLITLTLITLFAAALILRIDCVYDPD